MKTDALFFRVFEEKPEWFFALLGIPESTAALYRFSAPELKDTSHRVDGLFKPKTRGLPLYFLEVQFYRQPEIFANLLAKVFRYLKQHDPAQEWRGVVLFGTRTLEPLALKPYQPLFDAGYVIRVYLDELPERGDAPLGLQILQLISHNEAETPRRARDLVARTAREITDENLRRKLLEWIETVVFYRLPRLSRKEIQAMLEVDDIRDTRVYQEALQEGERKGERKGERAALIRLIPKLLAKKMSAKEIAGFLELDVRVVRQVIKKLDE